MPITLTTDQIKASWLADKPVRDALERRARYYAGQQAILEKTGTRHDGHAYNKVVANWTEILVNRHVGFLTSKPFAVTVADGAKPEARKARDNYAEVAADNNLEAVDARLDRYSLLYGYGVEVHSLEDGVIGITDYDPRHWCFILNENGVPAIAIHRIEIAKGTVYEDQLTDEPVTLWWLYGADRITAYKEQKDGLKQISETAHHYGRLPVFRWAITPDLTPLITDHFITLQDGYNKALSLHLDDVEADIDSLLLMTGFSPGELLVEDENGKTKLQQMRENKAILLPDKESTAAFITRGLPFDKTEFTLTLLRRLIHVTGAAPDIEEIVGTTGATSGIALRLQFQAMVERAGEFAKYVQASIKDQRVDLLNRIWGFQKKPLLEDFDVTVTFTIPANEIETWQNIGQLAPLLSRLDQARLVPSIADPTAAIEAKEAEEADVGGGGVEPLNGAQVTAIVTVLDAQARGAINAEAAGAAIRGAFPQLSPDLIDAMTAGVMPLAGQVTVPGGEVTEGAAGGAQAAEAAALAEQARSPDQLIAQAEEGLEDEMAAILAETGITLSPAELRQIIEELLKFVKRMAKR